MKLRETHVAIDRLTAMAFVARAPHGDDTPESNSDRQALTHVARCDRCARELARLTADAEALRDVAVARADAVFDEVRLESQRSRILDRLTHLGQAARVLRFPSRAREAAMPVSTASPRWVSVAAAAGLIIGLVAGQLLHFVPGDFTGIREQAGALQSPSRQTGPVIVPASAAGPSLTDDELLDEIEAAVQLRRASSLRALDALTPTANDFREITLGR